jgi:hypothetical protein
MSEECCICQETLDEEYALPECGHKYHANCIITWFRMGKNNCPLCNNGGINSMQQLTSTTHTHGQRITAYENYKKLRKLSRKKNASMELKNLVDRLKNWEKKNKDIIKDIKKLKTDKHIELTGKEVLNQYKKLRRRRWTVRYKIRRLKELIGFQQNITNIIIPIKHEM